MLIAQHRLQFVNNALRHAARVVCGGIERATVFGFDKDFPQGEAPELRRGHLPGADDNIQPVEVYFFRRAPRAPAGLAGASGFFPMSIFGRTVAMYAWRKPTMSSPPPRICA